MARAASPYVCQGCGAVHGKWSGRCDDCGAWNTIAEEPPGDALRGLGAGRRIDLTPLSGPHEETPRRATGIAELDRATGGGLVAGSALLVGGDPGIGKSTLLLQAVATLARGGVDCAFVSGEESVEQIRLRARRLGLDDAAVSLATATGVGDILATIDVAGGPEVVVIDSIQTMFVDNLDSAPGTVSQVRAAAQALIRAAKRRGNAVILVGHVTKDGQIAGPRVLEHMVDTVLYFEGERGHQFRILRAVKNRFGATDEIGVFEMTDRGLIEVPNPSELFLGDRRGAASGAAVFAGMEGTRPMLMEIQALVSPSMPGTPRRAVVGWDGARLAMVLAVLEARCGLVVGARDVYLNVAGGLRINEPAADLAVAAALISSLGDVPVAAETVFFGEIGLSGEVRAVSRSDARLKEAARLGFAAAVVPADGADVGIRITAVRHLRDLMHLLATDQEAPRPRARSLEG